MSTDTTPEPTKLKTGTSYTLGDLFAEGRRIIIPDLQRDYCWGNTKENEPNLVADFLNSLNELPSDQTTGLGLIYGYEAPAGHIHLCDGQQRLTTLFLLLGMLARQGKSEAIRRALMDQTQTPVLQYAIRETSLYFLKDLTANCFLSDDGPAIDAIRQADWYFHEYDRDPSIQSMLAALKTINDFLKKENRLLSRADSLLKNLTFLYVDMGDRKEGEETFVIINTTGEPLSAAENLKPIIVSNGEDIRQDSKTWEEIETWFWQYRHGNNDTADAGMQEFLRWITVIEGEKTEHLSITDLEKYRKALETLLEHGAFLEEGTTNAYEGWPTLQLLSKEYKDLDKSTDSWLSPQDRKISQKDEQVLLPILAYLVKYPTSDENKQSDEDKRNLKRTYVFFKNLARLDSAPTVKQCIRLVGRMTMPDPLCLLEQEQVAKMKPENGDSKTLWIPKTEAEKLKLFQEAGEQRNDLEDVMWELQAHPIFKGDISHAIAWATDKDILKLDQFETYADTFHRVFKGFCDASIDCVRRALLTFKWTDYPIQIRYDKFRFCWEWSDWNLILNAHPNDIKKFLDDVPDDGCVETYCNTLINTYSDQTNQWYHVLKNPENLKRCGQKIIGLYNEKHYLIPNLRWTKNWPDLAEIEYKGNGDAHDNDTPSAATDIDEASDS